MKVATEPLMSIEENNSLSEKVERFWSLDAIGISPTEKSVYERTEQSIKFVNGRYQVELPFKEEFPIIEDNYDHCVKRLNSLKRKLEKSPTLLAKYDDIMQKQLKDGIIEKIEEKSRSSAGNVTNLPHCPVVNEDKNTHCLRCFS